MGVRIDATPTGVLWLTIDNPERKNALTAEVLAALAETVERAATDDTVKVLVVTATGTIFCAGGDTNRMGDQRPSPWQKKDYLAGGVGRLARAFATLDKPVVAAINGPAIGAGVDLALWCDFRLAHPDAYLRLGFVDLGLTPGFGGAWLLTHLVGQTKALEILLLGEPVTATEAQELGLVRTVTTDLAAEAERLAERLAAKPGPAVRVTKRLVQRAFSVDVFDSLDLAWASFGLLQETPEHTEAVRAMNAAREARRAARA